MRCPVCNWTFERLIAEHCEDHHCRNPECYPRKEMGFSPYARIRDGWWFCERYALPFQMDGRWYGVRGRSPQHRGDETRTILYQWQEANIAFTQPNPQLAPTYVKAWRLPAAGPLASPLWLSPQIIGRTTSWQTAIQWHSTISVGDWQRVTDIPYWALPSNDDFTEQFAELRATLQKVLILQ